MLVGWLVFSFLFFNSLLNHIDTNNKRKWRKTLAQQTYVFAMLRLLYTLFLLVLFNVIKTYEINQMSSTENGVVIGYFNSEEKMKNRMKWISDSNVLHQKQKIEIFFGIALFCRFFFFVFFFFSFSNKVCVFRYHTIYKSNDLLFIEIRKITCSSYKQQPHLFAKQKFGFLSIFTQFSLKNETLPTTVIRNERKKNWFRFFMCVFIVCRI